MDSEFPGYVAYAAIKYLAYASWCYIGIRSMDPVRLNRLRSAAVWGFVRLLLGIGFGVLIFIAALTMNNATRNALLTYFAIYVPVRIVEWTILHLFVAKGFHGTKSIGWVLGGIVVSCLADIPLGIMEGGIVPVGRPLC